jgi:glycosyltransferase involved in cell wall biosynthesis
MRALWIVRADLERHAGGDTTQILRTADALRERGVEVELTTAPRPSAAGFDLAHLWHLDRAFENLPPARRLARAGLPIVWSPIWWPTTELDARGRGGLQGLLARTIGAEAYPSLRLAQRSTLAWLRRGLAPPPPRARFAAAARAQLAHARVLLPNSRAEAAELERAFGWNGTTEVVPNAADAGFFDPGPARARAGVACVGRIEPRKNQLALVEALADLDTPLTLVGRAGRFAARYERRCRAAAGPAARFVGALDRDGVRDVLRGALVHVCPSWYETPGLVSLEAALCGCRVVATPGGSTREYLGEEAWYADPGDAASLRAAVEAALAGPDRPALAARVRDTFTWEAAGRATLRGYERALGAR